MTNPELTEIIAILDRSGSMQAVKTETEGAFNSYVEDQRKVPGSAQLSLIQFDTKIETVYASEPLHLVPKLVLQPRGLTALYDAIGMTVVDFGEQFARMKEETRPGKVIVVILTDGEENSSRDWRADQLKALIKEQTEKYGWTFLYLGANQDAVFEGDKIGISSQNAITYDVNSMGAVVAAASAATTLTRAGTWNGFSAADRSAAVGKDVTKRDPSAPDVVCQHCFSLGHTTEEHFTGINSRLQGKRSVGWKPRSKA